MAKYNITSASQMIDIAAITNGCNKIDAAAVKFEECAKKVLDASNILDEKALAVDKTTMQPQLDADAQYIQSIKAAIEDFTMQVKNIAVQVHAEQDAELKAYQAQQSANANGGTTTP